MECVDRVGAWSVWIGLVCGVCVDGVSVGCVECVDRVGAWSV